MAGAGIPIRIGHAWAVAWLDIMQTPAIAVEGVTGQVKGFFSEIARKKDAFPHNTVNPQTEEINRLGRPKMYTSDDFPFAGCS
mmetsp:Transcript_55670/g.96661  ORF Transcript_55670/g.96661 Transcript_55670/m.96661 type:complete len:83 (-) Transcript_55670:144-392(-)